MTRARRVAAGIVLVILFGTPGAAVAAVPCGTARPGLEYEIGPDGKEVTPLGRSAGANIDFGAGALSCSDMYVAGNRQGLRLFRHDTPGLDVPSHRPAPAAASATPSAPPQIAFPGLPVSDDKRDTAGRPVPRTRDRPPATLRALNTWMSDHARRNGHVYLDYFTAAADSSGVLKPELNDDGLHPNAAAYAVMAPLAEKAIARALSGRP